MVNHGLVPRLACRLRVMAFSIKESIAMNDLLSISWWVLALRGVIALLFGILAFLSSGLTLLGLMALFAAYAFLGGIVSVIGALQHRKRSEDWGLPLLLGLSAVGAGVVAVIHPGLTAMVLVLLIGANALMAGVLDIATAIRLRHVISGEWMLILSGIASVVFGILVFLFPGAGALALITFISAYAIVTGVLLLIAAFRIRAGAKTRTAFTERRVRPDRRSTTVHPRPA
jgi:uncharacterized membrane protein HdeD (DUF308 family)